MKCVCVAVTHVAIHQAEGAKPINHAHFLVRYPRPLAPRLLIVQAIFLSGKNRKKKRKKGFALSPKHLQGQVDRTLYPVNAGGSAP